MFNRKEYMKKWREKNPTYMEKYRIEHKDKIKEQVKICYEKWYKNNPNYMKEYMRNYDAKGCRKEYMKEYRKNNIEHRNQLRKEKYNTDIKYKLDSNISRAIRGVLKGNKAGRNWEDIVGYTLNDLIKRLKSTMPKGYDWQDYLEGKSILIIRYQYLLLITLSPGIQISNDVGL